MVECKDIVKFVETLGQKVAQASQTFREVPLRNIRHSRNYLFLDRQNNWFNATYDSDDNTLNDQRGPFLSLDDSYDDIVSAFEVGK